MKYAQQNFEEVFYTQVYVDYIILTVYSKHLNGHISNSNEWTLHWWIPTIIFYLMDIWLCSLVLPLLNNARKVVIENFYTSCQRHFLNGLIEMVVFRNSAAIIITDYSYSRTAMIYVRNVWVKNLSTQMYGMSKVQPQTAGHKCKRVKHSSEMFIWLMLLNSKQH